MSSGKKRRLRRILGKDNRAVIVPIDHGIALGPIKGIENMQETVNQLIEGGADSIVLHKGLARFLDVETTGLIIQLSAMSNLSPNANNKIQVCSVEEAIKIGADAVSVHVNIGSQEEEKMLAILGKASEECDNYGIPLLAMMYPRGPKIKNEHSNDVVAHAIRVGVELGADIIKTNYVGEIDAFRKILERCPVPVVIAGGPKAKTSREVLQTTWDTIAAGGAGIAMGRNVFQFEKPKLMVRALSSIVHDGASVNQAIELLREKN